MVNHEVVPLSRLLDSGPQHPTPTFFVHHHRHHCKTLPPVSCYLFISIILLIFTNSLSTATMGIPRRSPVLRFKTPLNIISLVSSRHQEFCWPGWLQLTCYSSCSHNPRSPFNSSKYHSSLDMVYPPLRSRIIHVTHRNDLRRARCRRYDAN